MIVCELCVNQPLIKNKITNRTRGEYYIHRFNLDYSVKELATKGKEYDKFLKSITKNATKILEECYKDNWLDYKAHLFDENCTYLGTVEIINKILLN